MEIMRKECARGSASSAISGPWQTTTFSVKVWKEVLSESGVDKDAQWSLFLLSQLGDDGAHCANSIINKLLMKKSDGTGFRTNPSAFVNGCAVNARTQIEKAMETLFT